MCVTAEIRRSRLRSDPGNPSPVELTPAEQRSIRVPLGSLGHRGLAFTQDRLELVVGGEDVDDPSRLGPDALFASHARFDLDHRVPDAARGDDAEAARIAYGASLEATPIEIATALAAIANDGVLHAPWSRGEVASAGERVIGPDAAAATKALLEGAVARDDATGRRARVSGYRVAGKTGTVPFGEGARYGVFVGAIPAESPRLIVLVGVVVEGSDGSGGTVAAPVFARIARRLIEAEPPERDRR